MLVRRRASEPKLTLRWSPREAETGQSLLDAAPRGGGGTGLAGDEMRGDGSPALFENGDGRIIVKMELL